MKLKKANKCDLFLYIFAAIGFFFTLYTIYTKDFFMMNSDIAADQLLGKLLSVKGGILDEEWFYSTELHVFHNQLFYKYLFRIFPDNWLLVRLLASAIFMMMLWGSFYFMASSAGLKQCGLLGAAILMWPFGDWYLRLVTYGHSYATYLFSAFISMGCIFDIAKRTKETKRLINSLSILEFLSLVVIAFFSGCGGVRLLMICYAPLLLAASISFFLHMDDKQSETIFFHIFLALSVISFVASSIGVIIEDRVLKNKYSYVDMLEQKWTRISIVDMADMLGDAFMLFGWKENAEIISLTGIVDCLVIGISIMVVIAIIWSARNYNRIGLFAQVFFLFCWIQIILNDILLSCTTKYADYYWTLVIPFMIAILALAIELCETETIKEHKLIVYAAIAIIITLTSVSVYKDPHPNTTAKDENIYGAISWLQGQDYTYGFAELWSCDVIVPLTNGKIEMHCVTDVNHVDDLSYTYSWLQEMKHSYTLPEGRFFVLVSARDHNLDDTESAKILKLDDYLVYSDSGSRIFEFEDIQAYTEAMTRVETNY